MGTNTLIDVLLTIFIQPRRLQSNFSRENSYAVARLASLGLISTGAPTPQGIVYGNHWRLTHKGLRVLTVAGVGE